MEEASRRRRKLFHPSPRCVTPYVKMEKNSPNRREDFMLLDFSFENIFCFKSEGSLSMVASSDKQHDDHVSRIRRPGALGALRVAGIYGANAHGKTKLVDAFVCLKALAVNDSEMLEFEAKPFRLDSVSASSPSKLQVVFRVGEIDYEYGIICRGRLIDEEWLYETEKRQQTMIFFRKRSDGSNHGNGAYDFQFGAKLKSSKSPSDKFSTPDFIAFVGETIEENVTFLSEAFSKGVQRLAKPFNWFSTTLQIVKAESRYGNLHGQAASNKDFLSYLSHCLTEADTGIGKLKIRTRKIPYNMLSQMSVSQEYVEGFLSDAKDLGENERIVLRSEDGAVATLHKEKKDYVWRDFVTIHKGGDRAEEFELSDESSGTRRLLDLFPMLFDLKTTESVFVVDELDRKLHPLLAYNFVKKFLEAGAGQLIFTTHTTQLLDLDLLRRDEIWLCQKKDDGSSEVYSLSDFKIRPDLDIRKGYLQGRFGGIPILGDVAGLGWC